MKTESLLDQNRSFAILGPDEKIWFFKWESGGPAETGMPVYGWQAYSKTPGAVFIPMGPWSEASIIRFLTKHGRTLGDNERIDLYFYLHKGGIEIFLRKNRIKE